MESETRDCNNILLQLKYFSAVRWITPENYYILPLKGESKQINWSDNVSVLLHSMIPAV
jgi:hypothetical protein